MAARWTLLFLAVLAARMAHSGILWVEEAYPAAAAIQILHGAAPYRDFVFDKPPLSPLLYLLWGAHAGLPLRLAGAMYVLLCCWILHRLARTLWSDREGWLAASLTAFYLTFGVPSAVMALAPDLLMLAPHAAAVWLACLRRPWAAGAMAGVAALVHTKGLFVLAPCLLFFPAGWWRIAGGFTLVIAAQTSWLLAPGSLAPGSLAAYWEQVWVWGARYAADTHVPDPVWEGFRRTANWAGFHAAAVIAAVVFAWRERGAGSRRFLVWMLLALAGVCGGWRFSPRYYFLLLPAVILAASRGFLLLPRRQALAMAALLLVPLARFGPRYITLAAQGDSGWSDTAMNRDTREAARRISAVARRGDTLLVWGYRPDFYVYTRLAAGTPFLDSQPLTGVIADRHLNQSRATYPDLARANRAELVRSRPTFIVDGLGPFNSSLAIDRYDDLRLWLRGYRLLFRTHGSVVYHRSRE